MVNNASTMLDDTFGALANPTRRAILEQLARGESCVTELAHPFDMSLPAISKHLRILESAGLICREKNGRVHRCCLATDPLRHATEWLAAYRRFWEKRLDALADYLHESQTEEEPSWPQKQLPEKPVSVSPRRSRRPTKKSFTRGRTPKP